VAGPSDFADVSADGRYVAFLSDADLVDADTNDVRDVYLRDLVTGTIERVIDAGTDGNSLALDADGTLIAWATTANLLGVDVDSSVDVYGVDVTTRERRLVSAGLGYDAFLPDVASGRVVFTSSMAGVSDTFVYTWPTRALLRVSPGRGEANDPSISDDGRWVVFQSRDAELIGDDESELNIFLFDVGSP